MNNYKEFTDQIYYLYKSFIESGFTDYQAFELIEAYTRQSIFDSMFYPKKRTKQHVYRDYYNLTRERGDIFKNHQEA